MANTCDKCKNYTSPDASYESPNNGRCCLMGDSNDDREGKPNIARGWDYESYSAGVYVGPKFGCIHFERK